MEVPHTLESAKAEEKGSGKTEINLDPYPLLCWQSAQPNRVSLKLKWVPHPSLVFWNDGVTARPPSKSLKN